MFASSSLTRVSLAVLAATLLVSPAYADRDHHRRGWDDRWERRWERHDHGKHKGWYKHNSYYSNNRTVIVTTPAVVNRQVVVNRYYDEPAPVRSATYVTCNTNYNPLPTIIGGAGGGIVGAQVGKGHGKTAAIIAGTLIGGALGHQYTYTDQVCTRRIFETADVGTPLRWYNDDTGYDYTVTPVRDYRTAGRYCREYTATARVGGRLQETYGTACYQPDGSWEIVN